MWSCDSSKGVEEKSTPIIQRVSPRTITGILSPINKGAMDWGWQSFVAYGCYNHIVVIDMQNIKVFQTLEKHTSDIVKVKWANENFYHDLDRPYTLKLASLDSSGLIIVWNVKEGKEICSFFEPGKPATNIEWLSECYSDQLFLLGLHPPNSIVVWNANTGIKLWKKNYADCALLSYALDPFSEKNITFLASDCILFVDDFNLQKTPSSNGRKFYISNPAASTSRNTPVERKKSPPQEKNKPISRSNVARRMWLLSKQDSKISDASVSLQECLTLTYHKSYRHHLLLLYPKEILILDLEINQTVGLVSVDSTGSTMMQMYSCWQRDVFYILHESGCVSCRIRHKGQSLAVATPSTETSMNFTDAILEVTYDFQCQSDAFRLTKHAKIAAISVCPLSEYKIALLVSDGRLLVLDVSSQYKRKELGCLPPYLQIKYNSECFTKKHCEDILEMSRTNFPYISNIPHPANVLSDNIPPTLYCNEMLNKKSLGNANLKMFVSGYLAALAAPPHVLRMCPPVTFRNWTTYKPWIAVGNSTGSIQVVNVSTALIEKEYAVHMSPVRGIEWIGLMSFISYSHPNTMNNMGHVQNELVLTELQSGRMKVLRSEKEESPINMIRVSYLRQYVVIAFKEEPFEIWDLKQLILLRVMPKNFPVVTALEWSPGHYKKASSLDLNFEKVGEVNNLNIEHVLDNKKIPKAISYIKEHLVFTDSNGQLYHFSVEGNCVKNGSAIPATQTMGSVTDIAWKGDTIVLGDMDGNLNIWNIKTKISIGLPTNGGIKKIRFGPGKGNMRIIVLYTDGVDIFDATEGTFIYQVKCPREMPKIQDIDWVGSDRPILSTADGCLRIMDITLKQCSSSIHDYQQSDLPFTPSILSPRVSFYMKSFLHHTSWNETFSADIDQEDDIDIIWAEEQLQSLDKNLKDFIKFCPFRTAERCLHTSRIFGDQEESIFWTISLNYLKYKKYELLKSRCSLKCNSETELGMQLLEQYLDHPLDTGYDFLCNSDVYKKLQLDRVCLHLNKRTTYNQTQQCVERLLLLGETDQAVQLLLETEADNDHFYEDGLRACLIATMQSSGTSQSIIKLVSTNLIASGRILEGVQLLCLIKKSADGCHYLQGAGLWEESIWLAKATLNSNESQDILKRWVDHLCSSSIKQKNKAILTLLSMGEFWKVIQLLYSYGIIERAALFLQSCLEFEVLSITPENFKDICNIFLAYSEHLHSIKNKKSAIYYLKLVSENGLHLIRKFPCLFHK